MWFFRGDIYLDDGVTSGGADTSLSRLRMWIESLTVWSSKDSRFNVWRLSKRTLGSFLRQERAAALRISFKSQPNMFW